LIDDWERDARPAGTPPHTDRGADQSDSDQAASVESAVRGSSFTVEAKPTPSRGRVEILLSAGERPEPAVVVLFDSGGRRVRDVWSGDLQGRLSIGWEDRSLPAGVYYLSARIEGRTEVRKLILAP